VFAGAAAPPSVFDKYLQGGELMKRWDKQGNLDRAVVLLNDATRSDPSFALGFARLAEAQRLRYTLSRDKTLLDAATTTAEEAMRLNPELAPVQVAWGRVQAAHGNSDLAMASFERALRIDANDADAQLAIARQYERLSRLTDAEAAYQRAGSLDPDSIAAHDFYANFLFRQSRHADAIREWQTVIRLAPDDAAVCVNLGSSLNEIGRFAEAITMFQRALQLKPTDMAYSNLGTAYSRTGHYTEAIAAYREALELAENNSMAWGNLGFVYSWMNGLDDQAKQAFAQAIRLAEGTRKDNPRDPFIHLDLALYYAKTGNVPLAKQRIETALTLSPKGPEIQAAAAEVYELLGQRPRALASAKKSLTLGYPRQRLEHNPELSKLMPALK
jgi:tetratricopeptide (TPR) repeat protein